MRDGEPDQEVAKGDEGRAHTSRQPGDPPPTIVLTAPLGGLVSKLEVKMGQPVAPESALMEIIDLSSVHALARVPEHLAHKLEKGQVAHIRVPGFPEEVFESQLEHVGAVADAQSARSKPSSTSKTRKKCGLARAASRCDRKREAVRASRAKR